MTTIPEPHPSLAFERAMWLRLRQNLKASHHQAFGAIIILGVSLTSTFAALHEENYRAALPLALSSAFAAHTLRRQNQLTQGFALGEQAYGTLLQERAPLALQVANPAPLKLDDYHAHMLGGQATMNNRGLMHLAVSGSVSSVAVALWILPQAMALLPLGAAAFFAAKAWHLSPRPMRGTNFGLAAYGQEEYRFQQAIGRVFDLSAEKGRRQLSAEVKLISREQSAQLN